MVVGREVWPKRIQRSRGTDDLSEDVLEIIFSYLPIKSAVQMGVLSSRFSNSWVYCQNLDFGKNFARGRSTEDFTRIVDQVLNLHLGSKVCTFQLFFDPRQKIRQVEEWIRFAVKKGVEEVDIDFSPGKNLNLIPDFLLDCGSLKVLRLNFCEFLRPSFSFNGLLSLTTLSLTRVGITDNIIQSVFNSCLLLENLDLNKCLGIRNLGISAKNLRRFKVLKVTDCYNLSLLYIDAPTLQSLHYSGKVRRFIFSSSTLNLKYAMLNFSASMSKGIEENLYMRNLPFYLAHVNSLTVTSIFLQGLSPKYVDGEFRAIQIRLYNLKEFQLLMEKSSYCNPFDIVIFLKNCPFLERIIIDLKGFSFHCGYYWELYGKKPLVQLDCKFHNLKSVKLKGFKFEECELLLLKFVLEKAIVLEDLSLVPDYKNRKTCAAMIQMYHQLFLSWCASAKTKIVISENQKD
ncbi:putative FBD-associated F-box protein At1g61330 [Macadamia integrifolia]|uniref:putative FBD-associated F-box protein At1g61330 n=1 Tax=Macadamia integrifolia TaxID=60698 RepID=UPI001C4E34A3|nr:putative FBD-associated F-box protein At1g61330 [Macadamia integrifolia]